MRSGEDEREHRAGPRAPIVLGALVFGVALTLGIWGAGAAAAPSTRPVSACGAHAVPPSSGTQPACFISSWANPTPYATSLTAHLVSLSRVWVKEPAGDGYSHWNYTAMIAFHDPLSVCPQPTPLTSIPCQDGPAAIRFEVAGKHLLQPAPMGMTIETSSCAATNTSCVVTFLVVPEEVYGTVHMVWELSAGELIAKPGNDLGSGGAEFPAAMYIAHVESPK